MTTVNGTPTQKLDRVLAAQVLAVILTRLEENDFIDTKNTEQLQSIVETLVSDFLKSKNQSISETVVKELSQSIMDDLLGFGPLQPLLRDDRVSDILVNSFDEVFVEIKGNLLKADVHFNDDGHLLRIVRRMLAPLGKRIDESSPMVDARLADGSRINAIIPPVSLKGTSLSIRKFQHDRITEKQLVRQKSITLSALKFLILSVRAKKNILIIGGTGSGKTVLLNVLSNHIPSKERVITIEDSAELKLKNAHVVSLESRPPNTEGIGEITTRMLLKNALRMRPDRIIVGESRGDEVLDMLQAMNTGHLGSMSTLHANNSEDALLRLEMMLRMSDFKGSDELMKQMISATLDLIIHVTRDIDGHRRVVEIARVKGTDFNKVITEPVYVYESIDKTDQFTDWLEQR